MDKILLDADSYRRNGSQLIYGDKLGEDYSVIDYMLGIEEETQMHIVEMASKSKQIGEMLSDDDLDDFYTRLDDLASKNYSAGYRLRDNSQYQEWKQLKQVKDEVSNEGQ